MNISDNAVNQAVYYLPLPFGFIGSRRWLLFWDVLYYSAYIWQGPPFVPTTVAARKLPKGSLSAFELSSNRFSRLFYGLTDTQQLSKAKYEAGRKAFAECARQAQAAGLLYKLTEDDDPYLNNFGIQAENKFLLPSYDDKPITFITRPTGFVEEGWIGLIGNSYERHLINMLMLKPDLVCNDDSTILTKELKSCYEISADNLKILTLANLPFNYPAQVDSYQVQQAYRNCIARLGPKQLKSFDLKLFEQPVPSGKIMEGQADSLLEEQLVFYDEKDAVRGQRLRSISETGLVNISEFKQIWKTLTDFYNEDNFGFLMNSLLRRQQLPLEQRQLSWNEIDSTARLLRSKRGTHSETSRLRFPLKYRSGKLSFAANHTEKGQVQKAIRPLINWQKESRRISRVKLEGWVTVPNWRYYLSLPSGARPGDVVLCIRLLDSQKQVIFEDIPRKVESTQFELKWTVLLDDSFNYDNIGNHDLQLIYFEIQNCSTEPPIADWFSTSLRLVVYGQ